MGLLTADFRQHRATVLGVAVTPTFAQQTFAASLGVDFPLLSDWDRTVCDAYGVRYDSWKGHAGLAKRSIFVIDPAGVIRYRWVTDDALELPPLDEVLDVLNAM